MSGRDERHAAAEWQDWVGRETRCSAWLDPGQADRLRITLDREPGLREGDALPPGWHWLYFHDLVRRCDLGEDGHPRLGVTMPPVGLPRRMWAGGRLEFRNPLRLGDVGERVSTIRAITPKQGRSGPLCFVTVEHDVRVGGTTYLLEDQTIVYRERDSSPRIAAVGPDQAAGLEQSAQPQPEAEFQTTWSLDSTALFRYSALTFNGHRIHYDADYCRNTEGYPGLVIHGPLIATLLLDLAAGRGRPLRRFRYRARSPLFLPHAVLVGGRASGDLTALWASSGTGLLAMEAEAG